MLNILLRIHLSMISRRNIIFSISAISSDQFYVSETAIHRAILIFDKIHMFMFVIYDCNTNFDHGEFRQKIRVKRFSVKLRRKTEKICFKSKYLFLITHIKYCTKRFETLASKSGGPPGLTLASASIRPKFSSKCYPKDETQPYLQPPFACIVFSNLSRTLLA